MLLLPLSKVPERRGRRDARRCFHPLILLPHLFPPQTTRPNCMLAARAYHIQMATALLPPTLCSQHQLHSLQTSTQTLPSTPNCFGSQKPGEVLPLSTPLHHSCTPHRRSTMIQDTQRWTHKGESIFLLLSFILFLLFHSNGCRIQAAMSHCLYAYTCMLMIVQVSGSLWLFHVSS